MFTTTESHFIRALLKCSYADLTCDDEEDHGNNTRHFVSFEVCKNDLE